MHQEPPASATQKFQALYERHYDVVLPFDQAQAKFSAFLGLLSAVRTGASAHNGKAWREASALPQRAQEAAHDSSVFQNTNLTADSSLFDVTAE